MGNFCSFKGQLNILTQVAGNKKISFFHISILPLINKLTRMSHQRFIGWMQLMTERYKHWVKTGGCCSSEVYPYIEWRPFTFCEMEMAWSLVTVASLGFTLRGWKNRDTLWYCRTPSTCDSLQYLVQHAVLRNGIATVDRGNLREHKAKIVALSLVQNSRNVWSVNPDRSL